MNIQTSKWCQVSWHFFVYLAHSAMVSFRDDTLSAPNCIKHFHWTIRLFWPIRFDVTIVSNGNNCNGKPDWSESPQETVVKSNLISQYHPVNQGNSSYNWVLMFSGRRSVCSGRHPVFSWRRPECSGRQTMFFGF